MEDEPRDGSSTYLLISLPFTKHLRCSGEEMGQLSRERCITVITSFFQGGCFGLRDDADFVAECYKSARQLADCALAECREVQLTFSREYASDVLG